MKKLRIYQVDSFTRQIFHGNPAGVVANADGLTEEQMQSISRELNNSETAFIFTSDSAEYDVEVRFFTPTTEVPICGHATIAAHYVRAIEGNMASGRVIQKTKAGLLPVDILKKNGEYLIMMTQGKPDVGKALPNRTIEKITKALGISIQDIREDCPVVISSTGHSKVMVGIKSEERLHKLKPNLKMLADLSKEIRCNGYYIFTLHQEEEILVHGRMFAPAVGIPEDPVTGNANGPLGIYMVHYGICEDLMGSNQFNFKIIQGEAIQRKGFMSVHVEIENRKPLKVQITGEAVIVFSTEIEVESDVDRNIDVQY